MSLSRVRVRLFAILLGSVLGATLFGAEKAAEAYTGEQKVIHEKMEQLFQDSKSVNAEPAEKKKARSNIEQAVNWDAIAKKCLGEGEWRKQSASNRKAFSGLLKQVIILSAFDRLDKFWQEGTTYTYSKIDVKKDEAHVAAEFVMFTKRRRLAWACTSHGSTASSRGQDSS